MLLAAVVLVTGVAGSAAPSAPTGDTQAGVARRRPSAQCRIVDPSPRLAERRGARHERAALRRSQVRARAALPPGAHRRNRDLITRGPFYSAARTLDLEFGVIVRRNVPSDARVELRLLTPRGHLYQTLSVRAAPPPEPSSAKASRKRSASPRAAGESRAPRPLTGTLPVAGTAIVNHSLYGQWTVEPHLDGQPCGNPVRFWIGE